MNEDEIRVKAIKKFRYEADTSSLVAFVYPLAFKAGKQEGVKEVVEWVKSHDKLKQNKDETFVYENVEIDTGSWQAFLEGVAG